jgi:hypothetical protein
MNNIDRFTGKILLVGITLLDENEELIEQIQVYGPIIRIDEKGVIIKRNGCGSEFGIPSDFNNINEAKPGEYKLRSTGELVVNPDYISSWTVNKATKNSVDEYSKSGFIGYV